MVSGSRSLFSRTGRRTATLSLAIGLIAACDRPAPEPDIVRPVRYQQVRASGAEIARVYSGTTQAALETDLSFRVGGEITARLVDVGDVVSAGQPVAVLDMTDFSIRVQEAQAGLALAEAAARNAEASYARVRQLFENQNVSLQEKDAAEAAAESARAQLNAAAQQLEAARNQLSYTELRAPQECAIAQTFVEINQNVSPGQPIVRINCGQCAEVRVSVPDVDIDRITEGSTVNVQIDTVQDEQIVGIVREIGIDTGSSGATYPVTVALQEHCGDIRSGLAADVEFRLQRSAPEGALIVPFVSVGEDRNGNFVFVLEQAEAELWTAVRRAVTVAGPAQDGLIVTSGLSEGERIATAGVRRLVDGQTVRLLEGDDGPGVL